MILERFSPAIVAGLLALFVWLEWPGLRENTPTIDEFAHVPDGYAYWRGGPLYLCQNTPPFTRLLLAAPLLFSDPPPRIDLALAPGARSCQKAWALAQSFMGLNREHYLDYFFRARLVVVGIALLGGLIVFAWSRHYFGLGGGLFSLLLYCLSPEVLAHGGLATTDLSFSVLSLAALFFWALFLEKPSPQVLLAATLACAGACLTKHSGPLLFPLLAVTGALAAPRGRRVVAAATGIVASACTLCLLLLALYGPGQFPMRLRELPCRSQLGQKVASTALGTIAFPLPRDYVAGLDSQFKDAEATASYLFGETGPGRRYYYLVALAVKTPLPILAFLVAPLVFRRDWGRSGQRGRVLALILLPAGTYFAVVSASNLQIGIRYILPAYVLLLVYAGALAEILVQRWNTWARPTFLVLGGWLLAAIVLARPHFLPYFNEVGGAMGGDWILIDSNVDWGQDLGRLAPYLRTKNVSGPVDLAYFGHVDPGLYGIDWRPASLDPPQPGARRPLTVISVTFRRGGAYSLTYADPPVQIPANSYRWLEDYEPVDRVGRSLLIYELNEEHRKRRRF